MHGLINYNTLVVQAVEILNGGGVTVGNITINATICKSPPWDKCTPSSSISSLNSLVENVFPSTIPPVQVPGPVEGILDCIA